MEILHSFPIPDIEPSIPPALLDKIVDHIDRLEKVDILTEERDGWRTVNVVNLDTGEDPTDVAKMVKLCGDHDAEMKGKSAKYRAQMWVGGKSQKAERRYVTFWVVAPGDDAAPNPQAMVTSKWHELYRAQADFTDRVLGYCDNLESVNAQNAERQGEVTDQYQGLVGTLIEPYQEGLRLKQEAIGSAVNVKLLEAKLKQAVEAKANAAGAGGDEEISEIWSMLQPAITTAVSQITEKFVGGADKVTRALPPAKSSNSSGGAPKGDNAKAGRSLHTIGSTLLDSLGAGPLFALSRLLEETEVDLLQTIAESKNDLKSAQAIVSLMQALTKSPATLLKMSKIVGAEKAKAFQQIGALAGKFLAAQQQAG